MRGKKQRNGVILIGAMAVIALVVILSVAKIKNENKIDTTLYKTVTDVPGCEFATYKKQADSATAVMEISKNVPFLDYETYSYKNGKDLYLLFNMKRFIIAVKKGTDFHLSENGAVDALKDHSLQGIWFSPTSSVKKNGNRYSVSVTAEVVITNTLYNDFTGELVTIERDGEEIAFFSGYVREDDEEIKNAMKYIATTVRETEEEDEGSLFSVDMEVGTIKEEVSESEEFPVTEEPPSETKEESTIPETEQPSQKEEQAASEEENSGQEEKEDTLAAESTMREVDTEEENIAYSSNPYSMLPLGGTGYMDILNERTGEAESAYIRISDRHGEEETLALIEEYRQKSGLSLYDEIEIPENCHLESVDFDVRYLSNYYSYVNLTLRNVQGEEFRYRGMKYKDRTYDIPGEIREESDWIIGQRVFFVIPDGCTEYSLQCGGAVKLERGRDAWFYINTN